MRGIKQTVRKAGTALLPALFVFPAYSQTEDNVTLELRKVSLVNALQ